MCGNSGEGRYLSEVEVKSRRREDVARAACINLENGWDAELELPEWVCLIDPIDA